MDAIFKDAPYSEELDLDEHDVSIVDAHKLAKVNQLKTQTQNHTKILFQQFLEFIKVMKKHVNSSSSWLNLFQGLRTCKSSMGPSGNCKELLSQASNVKCQRGSNMFKS